jgi:hypothetical protein
MKFTKKLSILVFIAFLLTLSGCIKTNHSEKADTFSRHQLELTTTYPVDEGKYSLAFEITGVTDKVHFIKLYDYDITTLIGSTADYKKPIYSFIIDERWDENEHPTRGAVDAFWEKEKNEIIVLFHNGEKEIFSYE